MTSSAIKNIQINIKKYRLARGFTQEQLSELCEISADYMSHLERGTRIPSLRVLVKIAETLNVTIGDLAADVELKN